MDSKERLLQDYYTKEKKRWMDYQREMDGFKDYRLLQIIIDDMDYKRDGLLIKDYQMDGLQDYYYYYQRERLSKMDKRWIIEITLEKWMDGLL